MSSISRCNHEVTELTWENGQLSLHGLGGINLPSQTSSKQTWSNKQGGTLESIVHQATTSFNNNFPSSSAGKLEQNSAHIVEHINQDAGNLSSMAGGKWRDNSSHMSQIEQNHDQVKENSFCGEKWRKNPNHMQVQAQVQQMKGKWKEKYLTRHVQMDAEKGVKVSSMDASNSAGKLKRVRCESERKGNFQMEEISACGSASATFCRDTDTTMMTWPANSFESPRSMKTARTVDDDSLYHDCSENQDGERITKGESFRSQSSARRSRAAAIHNLSERRRRDRINQKMKTLQKLVPNASKTDKASMLDEVIEYLKQLQAQVHMMSNARNMPQMAVMPLRMQQQLQMSLLARMAGMGMGMGIGMGMLDVNNLARNMPPSFPSLIHAATPLGGTAPSFVSPPFSMPPVVPPSTPLKTNVDAATINTSIPNFSEAYNTFLAQQSMNMDFLNKMSALYRQQNSQLPSKKPVSLSLPNDAQRE